MGHSSLEKNKILRLTLYHIYKNNQLHKSFKYIRLIDTPSKFNQYYKNQTVYHFDFFWFTELQNIEINPFFGHCNIHKLGFGMGKYINFVTEGKLVVKPGTLLQNILVENLNMTKGPNVTCSIQYSKIMSGVRNIQESM